MNKRCYNDVVMRQFGQWDDEWQQHHFEKKWDPSRYQVICCKGRDVGALSVKLEKEHIFLAEIQIDPEIQNQGLGTKIINDIIADAQAKGLPVRLRVLRQNKAKKLYVRLGFMETGQTDTHIFMEKNV